MLGPKHRYLGSRSLHCLPLALILVASIAPPFPPSGMATMATGSSWLGRGLDWPRVLVPLGSSSPAHCPCTVRSERIRLAWRSFFRRSSQSALGREANPADNALRLTTAPGIARHRGWGRGGGVSGVDNRVACPAELHQRRPRRAVGTSSNPTTAYEAMVSRELDIAGGEEFHLSSPGNKAGARSRRIARCNRQPANSCRSPSSSGCCNGIMPPGCQPWAAVRI